jgi:ubiquinone/menaquinone biosynthesis C-methylase UbiE
MNQAETQISRQALVDAENAQFWNELCGSGLARQLGISDHSLDSLHAFDAAYLSLYPYLLQRVPAGSMAGQRVLEVGLGYGTLGQRIAESKAIYTGLDIAAGPVRMMKHRLALQGLPGSAREGSVLECPFPDESFDCVVAIGCFHHTGNVQRALDETWRVIRPGGKAYIMVYNKFSLRQWGNWPGATLREWLRQLGLAGTASRHVSGVERRAYDANAAGNAAPETQFLSMAELRRMCARFTSVSFKRENCDPVVFFGRQLVSRERALNVIGPIAGLDIYLSAVK